MLSAFSQKGALSMKALRVFLIVTFLLSLGSYPAPVAAQLVLPAGTVINSADLSIYVSETWDQPVSAHRITADWVETAVTWVSFANAYDPAVVDTFTPVLGWNTVDILPLVQGWVDGSISNQGVLLAHDTIADNDMPITEYYSSEWVNPDLRPQLEICYTVPGGSETCTTMQRSGAEAEDVFDTTVRSNVSGMNFGTDTRLYTRYISDQIKYALLRFDIQIESLEPGVELVKYTNGVVADDPNGADVPQLLPGDAVVWTYRITNTGETSVPREQITVTDNQPGVTPVFDEVVTGDADTLFEPGEVWDYTATGVAVDLTNPPDGMITVEDACTVEGTQPGATAYVNQGTVSIPGDTDSAESSYCNGSEPGVELVKYTNGVVADDPNGADVPYLLPGDAVVWTYRITNTGETSVPREQITVTDNQPGVMPVFDEVVTGDDDTLFEPGEVWDYTATGTAVDLSNPPDGMITVEDACTVEGTQPGATAYVNQGTVSIPGDSDEAESSYFNGNEPGVVLVKYTNGVVADDPNGADVPRLRPGDAVVWTYRITNTGGTSVPREQITVTDNQPGVTPVFDEVVTGDDDTIFEPGEVWDYTASGTAVDLAEPPDGMITVPDVCTVEGTQPGDTAYVNQGTVSIPGDTDEAESSYCNDTEQDLFKYWVPLSYGSNVAIEPEAFQVSIGYEDLPLQLRRNDFDYNDWVIEVTFTVRRLASNPDLIDQIIFDIIPTARGSVYSHTFSILLPANTFASNGTSTVRLLDSSTRELQRTTAPFVGGSPSSFELFANSSDVFPVNQTNTFENRANVRPLRTASLTIDFNTPVLFLASDFNIEEPHGGELFFQPQIHVLNTGDIIGPNDLRMLVVPQYQWSDVQFYMWPEEYVRIDRVYTQAVFHAGNPPVIDFPANWWLERNTCVYDGIPCVLP